MRSDIIRGPEYQERLKRFINEKYDLGVKRILPAKRGYYGETWKLEAEGSAYFVKLDYLPYHQKRFRDSLAVMAYLCDHGIDFIGRVIETREQALYSVFDSAILGVFPWIEGRNVETDATKTPEYQLLCQIYNLPKPGFALPTLVFSDEMATRFYRQWKDLKAAPASVSNWAVLSLLESRREELAHFADRLSQMASLCAVDAGDFYITHGDAGGNFFVGRDKNYIFDWDEVMYAPLERDAWVMGCRAWARKLFNDTLAANHIGYQLRSERLAFFCYHMFFFYLGEFMNDQVSHDMSARIEDYFRDGWIWERLLYADQYGA